MCLRMSLFGLDQQQLFLPALVYGMPALSSCMEQARKKNIVQLG